jgi:hypothetical protein
MELAICIWMVCTLKKMWKKLSIILKVICFNLRLIEAADYNNSDGHFNYGSLFLLPSTREIERNKRIVNDCVLFINTLKAYHHLN